MKNISFPQPDMLSALRSIFSTTDNTHGYEHALEVERKVRDISGDPEFKGIPLDMTILSAAALLHDVGYTRFKLTWLPGQVEHVDESVNIAHEILEKIESFSSNREKIRQICYLIKHHDHTNHAFPIYYPSYGYAIPAGEKEVTQDWLYIRPDVIENVQTMLAILREADSSTASGRDGAKRTFDFSVSRGIPIFSSGNKFGTWMWEESAVGNVRLAAKRALLDAYSEKGKLQAYKSYLESEELIREKAQESNIEYQSETHSSLLSNLESRTDYDEFCISKYYPWSSLVSTIKNISLKGDINLKPYKNALIESKVIDIDELYPLAYYMTAKEIRKVERLWERFMSQYALNPVEMSGIIEISHILKKDRDDSKSVIYTVRTAPPVVEIYTETRGKFKGERISALVDGLHRCYVAKQQGLTKIRAIVISDVPDYLPLMPLPLSWEDIKIFEYVPTHGLKREFRFPDISSFPDISKFSPVKPTEDTCQYFFYRDFKPLGSEGIREQTK